MNTQPNSDWHVLTVSMLLVLNNFIKNLLMVTATAHLASSFPRESSVLHSEMKILLLLTRNKNVNRTFTTTRTGADFIYGTCHHFYKWLGTGGGGTVSRRTANNKLTKLY